MKASQYEEKLSKAEGANPKKFMETHSLPVKWRSPLSRWLTTCSPTYPIFVCSSISIRYPSFTLQMARLTVPLLLIV